MGSWGTGCTLALGAQRNFEQSLALCLYLCVYKKEKLLNVLLNCSFMPCLLDYLDMPRYGSESKSRYTPRLVSRFDYDFDQWSVVNFVIKKLCVYLFTTKQCIYLVIEMYFMQIYFNLLWSGNKFTKFVIFLNFLLNLRVKSQDKTQFEGKRHKSDYYQQCFVL